MTSAEPPAQTFPPQRAGTNGYAIASFVLSIVLWGIGSILAIVFGHMAKKQIDEGGGVQGGRGLAVAGIVIGWVGIATVVLFVLAFVVFALGSTTTGGDSGFVTTP